jgi:hypothetical protein
VLTIGAVIFEQESDQIGQTFAIRLPLPLPKSQTDAHI